MYMYIENQRGAPFHCESSRRPLDGQFIPRTTRCTTDGARRGPPGKGGSLRPVFPPSESGPPFESGSPSESRPPSESGPLNAPHNGLRATWPAK